MMQKVRQIGNKFSASLAAGRSWFELETVCDRVAARGRPRVAEGSLSLSLSGERERLRVAEYEC